MRQFPLDREKQSQLSTLRFYCSQESYTNYQEFELTKFGENIKYNKRPRRQRGLETAETIYGISERALSEERMRHE